MWNHEEAQRLLAKWVQKLRLTPGWDIALEWVQDAQWRKTADIKIDCHDRKAILLLNEVAPKQENLEEMIVHELMHLKLYPLDQVTEGLIKAHYTPGTPENRFVYHQFFGALEQTVEEMTKCFMLEFGENRELSFGRCRSGQSFSQLYEGLNNLK